MKKLSWFFLVSFLAMAVLGCGHLKAPVITSRDLTTEEAKYYRGLDDDFRLVMVPPLFIWGKALVSDEDTILMGKLLSALDLPVPIVGFGPIYVRGAIFEGNGERKCRFSITVFAPLFSNISCKMKNDGQWESFLNHTTFLHFFGFGHVGSKPLVRFFLNFGASQEDIDEVMPNLGIGGR